MKPRNGDCGKLLLLLLLAAVLHSSFFILHLSPSSCRRSFEEFLVFTFFLVISEMPLLVVLVYGRRTNCCAIL